MPPVSIFFDRRFDADCQRFNELTKRRNLVQLKMELKDLAEQYSKVDEDQRSLALARFVCQIRESSIVGLGHNNSMVVYTRYHPEITELCVPFVREIVNRELPKEATSIQFVTQLKTFSAFFKAVDDLQLRENVAERQKSVRSLVMIWVGVERTLAIFEPRIAVEPPEFPKSLKGQRLILGATPSVIEDPKLRQDYETYLERHRQYHQVRELVSALRRLRKHELEQARDWLANLYGEESQDWSELRQIVAETINDEAIAARVLRGLTEKSQPKLR